MDKPILMKPYTLVVYDPWMCMKEDNLYLKKIIREIIPGRYFFVQDGGMLCDLTHSSSYWTHIQKYNHTIVQQRHILQLMNSLTF